MPYVRKGEEIINCATGAVHLTRCDLPMSEAAYLGDEESGPWRFRIKRKLWFAWTTAVEYTPDEVRGLGMEDCRE